MKKYFLLIAFLICGLAYADEEPTGYVFKVNMDAPTSGKVVQAFCKVYQFKEMVTGSIPMPEKYAGLKPDEFAQRKIIEYMDSVVQQAAYITKAEEAQVRIAEEVKGESVESKITLTKEPVL